MSPEHTGAVSVALDAGDFSALVHRNSLSGVSSWSLPIPSPPAPSLLTLLNGKYSNDKVSFGGELGRRGRNLNDAC